MSERQLLTASRLRAARSCTRMDHLRYRLGVVSNVAEDENLAFGSLIHAALEAWWIAMSEGADPLFAASNVLGAATCDPFDRERARAMIVGYDVRWMGQTYEVLAVEQVFRDRLRSPETGAPSLTFDIAGKIDALVRDERGRVLIVEHKTSSEDISPGSDYWKRLRMDAQVSIYYEGAAALGHRAEGCIYDVLKKPALRPLKATPEESRKYTKDGRLYATQRDADETPEEYGSRIVQAIADDPQGYYGRGEVVRLESEIREAQSDVWQTAGMLREAARLEHYPRNPDACVRYGKTCEFFPICSNEASIDDTTRYRRRETLHPELAS